MGFELAQEEAAQMLLDLEAEQPHGRWPLPSGWPLLGPRTPAPPAATSTYRDRPRAGFPAGPCSVTEPLR